MQIKIFSLLQKKHIFRKIPPDDHIIFLAQAEIFTSKIKNKICTHTISTTEMPQLVNTPTTANCLIINNIPGIGGGNMDKFSNTNIAFIFYFTK